MSPEYGRKAWIGVVIAGALLAVLRSFPDMPWWAYAIWAVAFFAVPVELLRVDAIQRERAKRERSDR